MNNPLDAIRIDAGTFDRKANDCWTVVIDTKVFVSLANLPEGTLLPAGAEIRPRMFRPNSVDLVNVLNEKCRALPQRP